MVSYSIRAFNAFDFWEIAVIVLTLGGETRGVLSLFVLLSVRLCIEGLITFGRRFSCGLRLPYFGILNDKRLLKSVYI